MGQDSCERGDRTSGCCKLQELKEKYHPTNPDLIDMMKLLESEEGSDFSFKIGDMTIPAHKLILRMNAPA